MKTIIVASCNPVKIQATQNGFQRMFSERQFQVKSVSAPSRVREQPLSASETRQGASNRLQHVMQAVPGADYWVAIEGGLEEIDGRLVAFAWVIIKSRALAVVGESRSGSFLLPQAVTRLIQQGYELGKADDIVFDRSNSKQENGSIGILTHNIIDRIALYEHAVILALVPFKNEGMF